MKYFVGYLIQGDAAQWHIKTAKRISEKFNTWKIHEKIPPHITVCYLDELEDISSLREYLKDWVTKNHNTGTFHLNGFGHFDDRVVFAQIEADEVVVSVVKELGKNIKNITGITKEESFKPHATLANRISSEEIQKIWEFTKELDKPNFTFPFNNITIFKYMGDKIWVVDESFELQ